MCAGAGDTLSVGARSALADMRGPGVRLPRAGWGSRRTSARCSVYYVCVRTRFSAVLIHVCEFTGYLIVGSCIVMASIGVGAM